MNSRRPFLICLTITAVAFALRVFRLDGQSLWWDEIFTVVLGRTPFPQWFTFVMFEDRAQVPLFHFFIWLWTELGTSEFVVRLFSAMAGTAAVPMIYRVGSLVGGRQVGIVSAVLLAVSPFHIWYSQELRTYALISFVTLLSSYLFLRLLKKPTIRIALLLAVTHLIGMYLHYLFALIALAQMIFLVLMRRRYNQALQFWFWANVLAGIFFLPWVATIFLTGGFAQPGWIPSPQWYDPILSIYTFVLGSTNDPRDWSNWMAPLVAVACAVYAIFQMRRQSVDNLSYLLLWFGFPILFVFLVSLPWSPARSRSIYMDRYLTPALPALLILVSMGVVKLFQARRTLVLSALVVALPLFGSLWNLYFDPAYARDDWRAVGKFMQTHADSLRDLVVLDIFSTTSYDWYDRMHLQQILITASPDEIQGSVSAVTASKPIARVWLVSPVINPNAHLFAQDRNTQRAHALSNNYKKLFDRNYTVESETMFQGILITAYEVK